MSPLKCRRALGVIPMRLKAFVVGGALSIVITGSGIKADWLELGDGSTLRGIDLKKGARAQFTLEDGRTVSLDPKLIAGFRPSPVGETVDFRGRQVSLREKVR